MGDTAEKWPLIEPQLAMALHGFFARNELEGSADGLYDLARGVQRFAEFMQMRGCDVRDLDDFVECFVIDGGDARARGAA